MKKIIVFFMALITLVTISACGVKPTATVSNPIIGRSSYTFDLKVEDKDIVTKGSVLVNFYKLNKKDEELTTTKTLSTFSETVSVTGLTSNTEYRADVLCTYNKKSHIIYSWTFTTNDAGTVFDPIEIKTPKELVDNLAKDYSADAYYVLANDIDFSEYKDEEGKLIDFSGISTTSSSAFQGHLDGNGFTIKNAVVTTSQTYNGFFGYLKGYVENIHFDNIKVSVDRDTSTSTYSGILAGYSYQAKINNVYVNNSKLDVYAKSQYTGGLVGYAFASNINYTKLDNIELTSNGGTNSYVGGITAYLCQNSSSKFGKIYNATINGKVDIVGTKTLFYGGIVGSLKAGARIDRGIANINATIKATNTSKIGGIVGQANLNSVDKDEYIKNVVAKGNITFKTINDVDVELSDGSIYIGGLVGSATQTVVDSAYVELDIVIEAKLKKDKELYAGLAFGNGFELHTELHNAIINGSIEVTTTDSEAESTVSIHGYDGSVYIDGMDEKSSSYIDSETVKYVKISLDVDGTTQDYPQGISLDSVSSVATWDKYIWDTKVESNKLVVTFKN